MYSTSVFIFPNYISVTTAGEYSCTLVGHKKRLLGHTTHHNIFFFFFVIVRKQVLKGNLWLVLNN